MGMFQKYARCDKYIVPRPKNGVESVELLSVEQIGHMAGQTVGDPGDQQTYPPLQGKKKRKRKKSQQLKDRKHSKRWFHHLIEVLQIIKALPRG